MASPHSLKKAKIRENVNDLISNLPTNVTHKILNKLPLLMATRTSVLSKTRKDNWSSLGNLVFDAYFWESQKKNGRLDGDKYCSIVTNVLLAHNGPIYEFHLFIPRKMSFKKGSLNLIPWMSFLSNNGIKKLVLVNCFSHDPMSITSHIFHCSHLVKLRLERFTLNPPPIDFVSFANLRKLELVDVSFKCDPFQSLIAKCPLLEIISLMNCSDIDHIVIDSLSIKTLIIEGACESFCLKNIQNGTSVALCLTETKKDSLKTKLVDAMEMLAMSSELQFLHLGGDLCKFSAGSFTRLLELVFNHLVRLSLTDLNLDSFDAYYSTCHLILSCPNIKDLQISVTSSKNSIQQKYFCFKKKHNQLRKVKIMGIKGTIAELKLIKYLLAISVNLEKLVYKCEKLKADSEIKMLRKLMKFRRASPRAQLVHLKA